MRFFTALLLVFSLFASLASAELLMTANAFGKGKWLFQGNALTESNVLNNNAMQATMLGGAIGYGLTERFDLVARVGLASATGYPPSLNNLSQSVYGALLKCQLLDEAVMPVSLAVGVGYYGLSQTVGYVLPSPSTEKYSGAESLFLLEISKDYLVFNPYLGLAYRSTNLNSALVSSTQVDVTLGTAFNWTEQSKVLIELTEQMITPGDQSHYSSGSFALGIQYKT